MVLFTVFSYSGGKELRLWHCNLHSKDHSIIKFWATHTSSSCMNQRLKEVQRKPFSSVKAKIQVAWITRGDNLDRSSWFDIGMFCNPAKSVISEGRITDKQSSAHVRVGWITLYLGRGKHTDLISGFTRAVISLIASLNAFQFP